MQKQEIKYLQNHVQVFFAHPLLPFFFSGCRLRSTWSDESGQMRKKFHEKKKNKQLHLPFIGPEEVGCEKKEKTKIKIWSPFVVSHHPSFMFVKRKAKAGGC